MFDLTDPIYSNPDAARAHLEKLHWPHGPVCPRCGSLDGITKLQGKSTRSGVYKCNACRKPFSVTVGTVFEDSKIPLNKWLLAFRLMASSKKGMSAHQLHRSLGVTYKTAWFMAHRIRESMRSTDPVPMGGNGGFVEADETYIGRRKGVDTKRGGQPHKMKVIALVERSTGMSRAFVVDNVTAKQIEQIVFTNVRRDSVLMTDEAAYYLSTGKEMIAHHAVNHSQDEYVRGIAHTNTIEGYFSIFKRGMKGIYQHCGEQHLHRYLSEFDFRYTHREATGINDKDRTYLAIKGARGKRLTYRRPDGQEARA